MNRREACALIIKAIPVLAGCQGKQQQPRPSTQALEVVIRRESDPNNKIASFESGNLRDAHPNGLENIKIFAQRIKNQGGIKVPKGEEVGVLKVLDLETAAKWLEAGFKPLTNSDGIPGVIGAETCLNATMIRAAWLQAGGKIPGLEVNFRRHTWLGGGAPHYYRDGDSIPGTNDWVIAVSIWAGNHPSKKQELTLKNRSNYNLLIKQAVESNEGNIVLRTIVYSM